MSNWYELKKNNQGQFSFALKAESGDVLLRSELYETRASAENGIASVQKNSPLEERYERKDASDGRFYFTLKAGNYQVIGTSPMYRAETLRNDAIDSTKTSGLTTTVKLNP